MVCFAGMTATQKVRLKNNSVPFSLTLMLLFGAATMAAEPPSLETFAMRPIVRDVDLSPSGEHLALMRLAGRGQNYVVDVYETEYMDRDPHTLGSEHMDIVAVDWANDERLLIRTRQPVEVPGRRIGYNRAGIGAAGKVKTYAWKLLSVGIDGGRWVELPSKSNITRFAFETYVQRLFSPRVVSRLAKEEDWVLIEWFNAEENGTEVFKVNVNNGQPRPVFKFSADYFGYEFDKDGNARVRSRANRNDNTITLQFRTRRGDDWSGWTDWLTWDVDEDRFVEILAFEPPDYNKAYVRWARDRDTQGIYLFDMERPEADPELLFATNRYDARDVVGACISQECVDGEKDPKLVGFSYIGDSHRIHYIDEAAAALQQSIDAALPPGNFNEIHDRAAQDKYIIVHSMGPQEPGRYYLLRDKSRIQLLGKAARYRARTTGRTQVYLVRGPGRDEAQRGADIAHQRGTAVSGHRASSWRAPQPRFAALEFVFLGRVAATAGDPRLCCAATQLPRLHRVRVRVLQRGEQAMGLQDAGRRG